MTSGVKPALPQMPMPRIEGKAAGKHAAHGNFADTLGIGKPATKAKSGEATADHQQVEARPGWPRMAAKLDTAIDRTHGISAKHEVEQSKVSREKYEGANSEEDADGELTDGKESSTGDSPSAVIQRHLAEPTQAAATGAATPVAVPMPTAETKQGSSSAPAVSATGDELPAPIARPVAPDVFASGQEAPLKDAVDEPRSEKAQPVLPPFVPMGRGEQAESTSFEPVSKPLHATIEKPEIDAAKAKETPADTIAEPAKTTPRVAVLAQQNIPAPMPSTAVILVESIAASSLFEPASRPAVDAIHASATHTSAQSLKIQLHPAELGMVTATLRFAGEQLSIELRVENHEAYRRLSSDSEVIVKSLRDLGYDIERVSVLQPTIVSSRSEGGAMQAPQGRASDQFGSGMAGGGNAGANGREPGKDGGNAGRDSQLRSSARTDPAASGGVYI